MANKYSCILTTITAAPELGVWRAAVTNTTHRNRRSWRRGLTAMQQYRGISAASSGGAWRRQGPQHNHKPFSCYGYQNSKEKLSFFFKAKPSCERDGLSYSTQTAWKWGSRYNGCYTVLLQSRREMRGCSMLSTSKCSLQLQHAHSSLGIGTCSPGKSTLPLFHPVSSPLWHFLQVSKLTFLLLS